MFKKCLTFILFALNCYAEDNNGISQDLSKKFEAILRPYVVSLDRDLWTFRYESKDSFQPSNVQEIAERISFWANRFYSIEIIRGADTGPGVYVATDPAATATWGGIHPRLLAIKIKQGTQFLIGDQGRTPDTVLKAVSALSSEMGCGPSSTSMDTGIGNVIGFFRMNQKLKCRQAIIEALKSLSVKAISYGFNSVPLEGCRVTGTAISIINSTAISLNELNRYSEEGNIEGQPLVTPFVHRLFEETQDDYYSQSLLSNLEVWSRYQNAYGFFTNSRSINKNVYLAWRDKNILKCGHKWNIEIKDPRAILLAQARLQSNPLVKKTLIEMALIYRDRFDQVTELPSETPRELVVDRIRKISKRVSKDSDTQIRLLTAQVPNLTGNPIHDEAEYLEILNDCLQKYKNLPIAEIVKGECGIDP